MSHNQKRCLLLGDSLTVILLLAGCLFSWLSAYGVPMNQTVLLLACLLAGPLSALLWSWPRGHWPALGLLAVGLLVLWRIWAQMKAGGAPAPGLADLLALPGVQLLLALALALALGWVAVRTRCWYLAALVVITPALPAILAGVLPDWIAFLAATAGWLSMLLAAFYSRRDPASLGRGLLLCLGGTTLLLAVLAAALPMEGYGRPKWATDARNSLISSIAEQAQRLEGALDWELPPLVQEYLRLEGSGNGSEGSGTGGAIFAVSEEGRVDLLAAGPRRYTGRTVLEVTGEESGRIYLRGGGASVYTGSSWEAVDERAYQLRQILADVWEESISYPTLNPLFYPALTTEDAPFRRMTIRHISLSGSTAYYPYRPRMIQAVSVSDAVQAVEVSQMREGVLCKPQAVDAYELIYRPGGPVSGSFTPLPYETAHEEMAYRSFVYENYLDVPQEAQAALAPLLAEVGRVPISPQADLPEQFLTSVAAAQRTASVLADAARYDLSTPAMDPGEDFVAQFLEEGRGYCVHFATAGALLLRMQGIPTRYVSGYVADLDEGGFATVLDSAAHAWVEIYLDGYGWYPVEMTPAYSAPQEETPEDPEEPSEEVPPPPETPEIPAAPEESPPDAPDTPEAPDQELPSERAPLDLRWLRWVGLALLLAAVPFGLRRLALDLRRRSRQQPDANRSAIAAYRRSLRLKAWGGGEEPALTDLARKAKFSQHTLTEAEREAAWQSLEDLFRQTQGGLPRWKRLLLGLLRPLF